MAKLVGAGIGGGRRGGAHYVEEFRFIGRLAAGHDVVDADFLDRGFLDVVLEAQLATAVRGDLIGCALKTLRTRRQLFFAAFGADGAQCAIGRAGKFDMVPRLVRQIERDRFAAFHIDVPIRQFEVIVTAGQLRAVVDARPGRLGKAVGCAHHALLDVPGGGHLDLADGGLRRGQNDRRLFGPAVTHQPFGAECRIGEGAYRNGFRRHRLARSKRGNAFGFKGMVVNANLVDVAAADILILALHLHRRNRAMEGTELVESSIEYGLLVLGSHQLAVDIETDARRFVPGKADVDPLIGRRNGLHAVRDADTREIVVGDEGVDAVTVPVDAKPLHVPTGMVGIGDAEDRELHGAQGVARPEAERQCAALSIDVAGRMPGEKLFALRTDIRAGLGVAHDRGLVVEIRLGIARRHIGSEAVASRQGEQQTVTGRAVTASRKEDSRR